MELSEVLLVGVGTWRLASLLVQEAGPFDCFLRFRKWAGVDHDQYGLPVGDNGSFLAKLFSCLWCTSLWAGALCLFVWWLTPWPVILLDVSAVAILFDWVEKK